MDVPRRPRTPGRGDLLRALVPAVLGVAAVAVHLLGRPEGAGVVAPLVGLALVALITLPLLWSRTAPVAVAVVVGVVGGGSFGVRDLLDDAGLLPWAAVGAMSGAGVAAGLAAALVAVHPVARHRGAVVLSAVLVIMSAPVCAFVVVRVEEDRPLVVLGSVAVCVVAYALLLSPVWVVGLVVGRRARRVATRARRAAEQAERAVRVERARVLRELQGVVLADLAAIAVQADRADAVLAGDAADPGARADARAALESVTATGRDTLTAMRRLLGMLRTTEPDGERAPQPTLDRLDELVEANRRVGLEVRVTVSGERRPLPDDVDLAAYRLLQRLLAGCGSAAPVRLQLSYADRALRLVARGDVGAGAGVAVREWARMVGGEVAADAGSSTVEVWLPTRQGRAA